MRTHIYTYNYYVYICIYICRYYVHLVTILGDSRCFPAWRSSRAACKVSIFTTSALVLATWENSPVDGDYISFACYISYVSMRDNMGYDITVDNC